MGPIPGLISCVQVAATTAFVMVAKSARWFDADDFEVRRVQAFTPYVISFVLSVYTNMKALQTSNVETVIVFRAMTPLLVSVLDWAFLGLELPDRRSVASLVGIIVGAVGYVHADGEFAVHGKAAYGWAFAYLLTLVFSMTEGKRMISKAEFQSPVWGSVYYTNALCLPGMMIMALASGEVTSWRRSRCRTRAHVGS